MLLLGSRQLHTQQRRNYRPNAKWNVSFTTHRVILFYRYSFGHSPTLFQTVDRCVRARFFNFFVSTMYVSYVVCVFFDRFWHRSRLDVTSAGFTCDCSPVLRGGRIGHSRHAPPMLRTRDLRLPPVTHSFVRWPIAATFCSHWTAHNSHSDFLTHLKVFQNSTHKLNYDFIDCDGENPSKFARRSVSMRRHASSKLANFE